MISPVLLTKDGVHEQHFSPVYIWRELGIVDLGFLCLLITLDEDLADADGATAVPESLFHGLTCGETQGNTALIKTLFIKAQLLFGASVPALLFSDILHYLP